MTLLHRRSVVLMFPGTGAQHTRMAAGLYGHEPVFTDAVDEVLALLGAEGAAARSDWLADEPAEPMDADTRSAPLLFAVNYAMGRLVESWGVRPAAYLGHSMGEFTAAVLAGVFGLDDAVRLLWERVRMQRTTPPGGMIAVAATPRELSGYLGDGVVVGAVNAPRHTVLSGPEAPLRALAARLTADGRTFRRLAARSPYHSPALAPLVAPTASLIGGLRPAPPRIPLYSAYTTRPLGPDEAVDPGFWAAQPTTPVMFWPTLERLLADGDRVLVEAGPAQSLAVLARGHESVRSGRSEVIATLPPRALGPEEDRRSVRVARERLAAYGGTSDTRATAATTDDGGGAPRGEGAAGHSGRLPVDLPTW
ncbi:acyltransferase domain-containing protein [Streptomyces sp. NPDC085481]|uniref:acyltransferase domain-containing protein n=1 Tax=Streptomyces sp. NPDC085481 TaxID=3365727 RepID=UPI0037D7F98D